MKPQANSPERQAASVCFPYTQADCSARWFSRALHRAGAPVSPQAVLGVCSDSPRSWGYCAGLNQSPLSAGRLKGVLHKFSKKRPLGQRRTFKIPQKGTLRQSWLFLSADIRWHRYCQPLAHTSATLSSIHPSCWLLAICIWGLLFLF